MIKHVVMWRLKENAEGNSMAINRKLMKERLLGLKPLITQIDSLEVGINTNPTEAAFDLILISTHRSSQDLKEYIEHPAHKEVVGFVQKIVAERKVVDFEY